MWHNNEHQCVYIYIYIYVHGCMRGSLVLWVAGRIIFNIFEAEPECLDILCLFWHKDHTKTCACKNLRDRKRDQRTWSVRSETPEQKVKKVKPKTLSRE